MKSSNSAHTFAQVPKTSISRSSFNRTSGYKTTFNGGYLVPFFVDFALPADTFNLNTTGFARLATPIHPVMDNMYMDTFFFAVPYRLLWDNFQKMMGEQDNPNDSVDFLIPQSAPPVGGYLEETLQDYMTLPTKIDGFTHSVLPLRAYNLIYNEWFRDQNLQNSVTINKDDGPDAETDYTILRRGKRHDYFTSALPFPQKGTAVDMPLGVSAPVRGDLSSGAMQLTDGSNQVSLIESGVAFLHTGASGIGMGGSPAISDTVTGGLNLAETAYSNVYADLSSASGATINQLRQAFQIQTLYERDARGGTRYTEIIRAHFDVTSPDARLQRPEFLGGGSTPVHITPVATTAESPNGSPNNDNVGDLGGTGVASFQGHGFTKSFTEHTIIIGILNVRADLTYQDGLNRLWSHRDKLDHYWSALAQIGEQEVLNKEIYTQGTSADDDLFGYQERYAEYRYKPSVITGLFRSNATQTLDSWHLSQDFGSLPTLSSQFIEDTPPIDRVIAIPSQPHFIADFLHTLKTARPMPLFGVPYNLGRF